MLTKRFIILSTTAVAVLALAILSTAVWLRHERAGQADGTATRRAASAPMAASHKPGSTDPSAATTVPFRPGMGPSGQQDAKPKRVSIAEFSAHAEQDMARVAARQAQSRQASGQTGARPAGPGAAGSTADQGATPDATPAVRQPQVLGGNPFRIKPPPHKPHVQPGPNPADNTPSTTSPG